MDGHHPAAGRRYRHDRPEDHGGARAPLRAPGTPHDGRQRRLRPRPRPGRGLRTVRGSGADLDHRGLELRADHVAHHRPGHLLRDRRVDPADDRRDRRFGRRSPLPEDPPAPPAHRRGRRHDRARAGHRDGRPDGAAAHDPRLHGVPRGGHRGRLRGRRVRAREGSRGEHRLRAVRARRREGLRRHADDPGLGVAQLPGPAVRHGDARGLLVEFVHELPARDPRARGDLREVQGLRPGRRGRALTPAGL